PGRLIVATGPTRAAADSAVQAALDQALELREARSERLHQLVQSTPFDTADETYDTAFRWAILSLDALVRRDSNRATIDAGLPGAEPERYPAAAWTFGAFLNMGRWDLARALLTTYGDEQLFDRRADLLGRAPDLVTAEGDAVFTTADATPLFLDAAGHYVRATGDRQLVQGAEDFWFKTVFAMRGIYEEDTRNGDATTGPGFLTARSRRTTWLEADPDRGGIERRGAPAEAQGALYRALGTATQFAEIMGVAQRSSASWYADTSAVLVRDVEQAFVRDGLVVDRIDGRPARDLRPGGLLALALLEAFPERGAHARRLAEQLVMPHGVASLAPSDSTFHPYVSAPEVYTEEAGRTHGAVWTWLAGPVATLLAETGGRQPAAELMTAQTLLLLDRGVIGAIPMLTDGHPRQEGAPPRAAGAPVQPWSLAGFLRATTEGFLGLDYANAQTLVLEPRLPDSWGETSVTLKLGRGAVIVQLEAAGGGLAASVVPSGSLPAGATLRLRAAGRQLDLPLVEAQGDTLAMPRSEMTIELTSRGAEVNGETVETAEIALPDASVWDGFAFADGDVQDAYPVMRIVESQRSLGGDEILRTNARARVRLVKIDPDGDDWGPTSTFTYPVGWPEGTLDAIGLELAQDDSTTYIEAEFKVVAPNEALGHPAAFAAIAIDTEPGGERRIGRDALYDYPPEEGYEFVIYAGRGLQIEDARGTQLGRLDASVYDPQTGLLSFALPRFILPELSRGTTLTLLVGALDPDGGVGSFRQVARQATDNVGGGRVDPASANVYDVILGTVR
ncbi:MAG: amylo-alpha-1,6-glucosidase, partial [Bacteroidota bacterium]